MAKVAKPDALVTFIRRNQHKVAAFMTGHLVQKAILRENTTLQKLHALIIRRFPELDRYHPDFIIEMLVEIKNELTRWEIEFGRVKLSALIVRNSGTEYGLPAHGFWKSIGQDKLPLAEKRSLTKHIREEVFNYYNLVVYEHAHYDLNVSETEPAWVFRSRNPTAVKKLLETA